MRVQNDNTTKPLLDVIYIQKWLRYVRAYGVAGWRLFFTPTTYENKPVDWTAPVCADKRNYRPYVGMLSFKRTSAAKKLET